MLPKGVLGRQYYRRLFVYSDNKINYKKINGEAKVFHLNLPILIIDKSRNLSV